MLRSALLPTTLLTLIAPAAFANPVQPVTVQATPEFSQRPEFSPQAANRRPTAPITQDLAVMATDVEIIGANPELIQIARNTIATAPGQATSASQLNADLAALKRTQLFNDVQVNAIPNDQGWQVQYALNPVVVSRVQLNNARVLTPEIATTLFDQQLGQAVQPSTINAGIERLNTWYQDNGYVLAKVQDVRSQQDGSLSITVSEGVVGSVQAQFTDDEGMVTDGRTRDNFVLEHLSVKPGEVFKVEQAQADLRQLYSLGLFEHAQIALADRGDNTIDVIYELNEAATRGVNVGGGYSKDSGVFGSVSYNDRNVGGIGQNLGLDLQIGTRDMQFNTEFSRAYRVTNPDQLGYSITAFRQRGISGNFDQDVYLENGDRPREGRFGGGVAVNGAIDEWDTSVGVNFRRVSIRDADGDLAPVDQYGNALSASESGIDDIYTVRAQLRNDQRDNPLNPTSGSVVSLSSEQSIPLGSGNILMNQVNASYSTYQATRILNQDNPEVLAFNVQGGTTIGDLPPYETFLLGGANTVRGFGSGDLAAGRSYVLASAEYRVPLFSSPVSGVVFADFASDLGSTPAQVGESGEAEATKPGTGFGYGAGVRVNSPIGILRADFGITNTGDSRLQFGVGHRF
ncbi:BamA/TamA family outer membrane protein [Spirulina major]|uniref:BamA/TamA family outer membrane protein n=1 Tax=Spirulina major TaxID=270636 RepID=UPI000934F485|nr:BamA/TamA family outer membrane protein [Spirulina major]